MKITLNKQYVLFLILFYTLIFNELLVTVFPIFQYEDEFIAVMAVPLCIWRLLSKRKLRYKKSLLPYIAGFVLCSLLGSLVYKYQPFMSVALPDMLLCMKFWLCIYTGKELFKKFDLDRFAPKLFLHVKLITWLFVLLTAADAVVDIFPGFDVRYGLESNMLFYKHPISLASGCSILIIISFAIKDRVKNCFFYVGLLSVIMFSTLRSKAIADVAVFVLLYVLVVVRKRKLSPGTILLFLPLVLLIGWPQIEYYFFELGEGSARAQLLVKGFQVAKDHFPLGAGFGTFGSHYSAVEYSPLYYSYGLDAVFGLSEDYGYFICDSFWPMVMAQSGYLGTTFYIGAIVMLAKKIGSLKRRNLYYYASGLAAVLYMIVDSVASTAFVHPLAMPIALWLGVLLADRPARKSEETASVSQNGAAL